MGGGREEENGKDLFRGGETKTERERDISDHSTRDANDTRRNEAITEVRLEVTVKDRWSICHAQLLPKCTPPPLSLRTLPHRSVGTPDYSLVRIIVRHLSSAWLVSQKAIDNGCLVGAQPHVRIGQKRLFGV